jgi:hypothetical protein
MNAQYQAIGTQVIRWIKDEGVRPSDICILHMGELSKRKLSSVVHRMLKEHGIELEVLKGATFDCNDQTVLATSPHSFKGYDAEIVVIPSVESFCTRVGQPLSQALYVASGSDSRDSDSLALRQGNRARGLGICWKTGGSQSLSPVRRLSLHPNEPWCRGQESPHALHDRKVSESANQIRSPECLPKHWPLTTLSF